MKIFQISASNSKQILLISLFAMISITASAQICTSLKDYETGLKNGLKTAPPCELINANKLPKCAGEYSPTTWSTCYGERTTANGSTYRGWYFDGKANGKGEFVNPDGTRYLGEYLKGQRNGYGKEYAANGTVLKEGQWTNGVFASVTQEAQDKTVASPTQMQHLGGCAGYHYNFALAAKNSNKMAGFNNSWNIAENLDAKYGKDPDYNGAKSRVMNHIASLVQKDDPNLTTALISYSKSCTQNGIATGQWN